MAGIGDYVHARYSRYKLYSTTEGVDGVKVTPPAPHMIYFQQKKALQNEVRRKIQYIPKMKENIEKFVNNYFMKAQKNNANTQLSDAQFKAIQEAITEYIDNHFHGDITLNSKTGGATTTSEFFDTTLISRELMEKINDFEKQQGKNKINIKALMDRYNVLMQLRNTIGESLRGKSKESKRLWKDMESLDKGWEQLEKAILNYAHSNIAMVPTQGNRTFLYNYNTSLRKDIDDKMERFDQRVNRLIETLKVSSAASVTGAFGELIIKASDYVLNTKANASVADILKVLEKSKPSRSKKGVNSIYISSYASNFNTELTALRNKKGVRKKFQGDGYTAQTTEDKVDATFQIQGIDVKASIKDYNLSDKDYITLETGANLLRFAQDYIDFTNHFLNIVGTRWSTAGEQNPAEADIALMHRAMKTTALVKALAGGVITSTGRNDAADVLIVNDNSRNGYYKVYFISEILENVLNATDMSFIRFTDYDQAYWDNRYIGTIPDPENASVRITKLVNTMRNMNIHIELSIKMLK